MTTPKKFYRLDEEIEVVLRKEGGIGRKRFKDIEAELIRIITIKTSGGKEKVYKDTIKKLNGKVEIKVKRQFCIFKFRVPFKKHQNVTTCIGKFTFFFNCLLFRSVYCL